MTQPIKNKILDCKEATERARDENAEMIFPAFKIINGTWQSVSAQMHNPKRTITLYEKDDNGQMAPFGIGIY
jgi:hypothetical protein